MSKKYYLRIEGVNLSNFVYDTQDLSTIRGGGLRLLDSIKNLKKEFNGKLNPISTGASSGLFEVNVSSFDETEKIKNEIETHVKQDKYLRHATFVVDILESNDSDNFVIDREKILALNRWKQMKSPSIAVPSPSQSSDKPCRIDMVRPATETLTERYKGEDNARVSESVFYRREYGRKRKHDFYYELTNIEAGFVNEFNDLTNDESQGNPHHKMAVIYIDGNGFGNIQASTKTQKELKCWDTTIKDYRKAMLTELLAKIKDKPEWRNGNKLRLETLLWGGDELIWVVPAWVGWQTLDFFYRHTKEKNWNFNGEPLKHGAGIVFCHHNAPIHRITKLAREELARLAKDKDRKKSLFVYQRLESFDHIGKSIQDYNFDTYRGKLMFSMNQELQTELDKKPIDDKLRQEFANNNIMLAQKAEVSVKKLGDTWRIDKDKQLYFIKKDKDKLNIYEPYDLVLDGEKMCEIAKHIKVFKDNDFPRSKLHQIVKSIILHKPDVCDLVKESVKDNKIIAESLQSLTDILDDKYKIYTRWFHIAELWDYITNYII